MIIRKAGIEIEIPGNSNTVIIKEMILDSSKTKEAVNYCLNRWENLENFIKSQMSF